MDDREDQIYKENEGATIPMGVHLRKLDQRYIKEESKIEKNRLAKQPLWLLNNIYFYYDVQSPTINYNKKQCFLQHKKI